MNNWKQFKNETPKEGQRIDAGAWCGDKKDWVSVNFIYERGDRKGWVYWRDATPPPAPSKMEQAWEALPHYGIGWDCNKYRMSENVCINRATFESIWQQCEKAYGLKEGGEAKWLELNI